MPAKENNAIAEAAQTMYQLSDDELVRERCRARQEHYRILQTYEDQIKEQADAIKGKDALIAKLQAQLDAKKSE